MNLDFRNYDFRENLDVRNCNFRKNIDLRKNVPTIKILEHKLLDSKIYFEVLKVTNIFLKSRLICDS